MKKQEMRCGISSLSELQVAISINNLPKLY
jgi:hypothetical protein